MNDKMEAWFQSLSEPQQNMLETLRHLILAADNRIVEEIKWNQPCYSRKRMFCYLQKANKHVTLGFQQGAHLSDPDKLLKGEGKNMRHVKIVLSDDIDKPAIRRLIAEALAFDES